MGRHFGQGGGLSMVTTEAGAEMPVHGKHGKTMKLFSHPSHRPWKSIMPISTFPHHDYDEDEYFLKPAGLRDTHSEGKVIFPDTGVIFPCSVQCQNWMSIGITSVYSAR